MYTVCGVKRSEENASLALSLVEWGARGFLTCCDGSICSPPLPEGSRNCLPSGGRPLITAAREWVPAGRAPGLPKPLATRSKGPRGAGPTPGVRGSDLGH